MVWDVNTGLPDDSPSPSHSLHEPVSIQRASPRNGEQLHVKSNSSPDRRGDSGLALSSESDIDSSYESSSCDSSKHSFPAVTLVENETGPHSGNNLYTSLESSNSSLETSHAGHMVTNHSVQTSLCEVMFTRNEDSHQMSDSETQTSESIYQKQGEVKALGDHQNSVIADKDQLNRSEKVHQLVAQLSVETGLRYSINADVHEN